MKPRRIAFWGNFGTRNLGNECTLAAAIHHARARLPGVEIACICTEPEDASRRHGVPGFLISTTRRPREGPRATLPLRLARRAVTELRGWRDALSRTRALDLLIMTGTGMLTDHGEGSLGLPYDIFRWAVAAWLGGCRLAFVSVGVEPMESPLTRFFVRTALRLASFRSYRDQQSRERLRVAGFFSDRDAVYPDLAFSLPESLTARPPPASGPKPAIAVGLYAFRDRGAHSPEDAAAYGVYLGKVTALLSALRDRGHRLRIVIGDNTYDEPVLADLRGALSARGLGGIPDEPAGSFEEVLDQLASVDLVLASRFHNVLLALLIGRPVVSVSYNEKNSARQSGSG